MGQSRQGAAQATQQAQGVSVTPQQRTRIRESVFASNSVPRLDNVNFAVRVGTKIPGSVHLVAVPETLINARGKQGAQGDHVPSSTGQAGAPHQPTAANPSSGAGMNAGTGGASSGAAP